MICTNFEQSLLKSDLFINRLSDLQWDERTLAVIPLEDRLEEVKLYDSKWWDYKTLHPAKATALFAKVYGEAYCISHLRRFGNRNVEVFRSDDWDFTKEVPVRARAFWKARRFCDEIGCPYEYYLFKFFWVAEDYFEKLPRPQELWRKDVAAVILTEWEELSSKVTFYPKDEVYHIRDNWRGLPCQVEWESYIMQKMSSKPYDIRCIIAKMHNEYFREVESLIKFRS